MGVYACIPSMVGTTSAFEAWPWSIPGILFGTATEVFTFKKPAVLFRETPYLVMLIHGMFSEYVLICS